MADSDLIRLLQKGEKYCADVDDLYKQLEEENNGAPPQDCTATNTALDILSQLGKQKVTTKILQDTKAGKRVKRMSKCKDENISKAALKVVDVWKKQVIKQEADSQNGQSKSSNKSADTVESKSKSGKEDEQKGQSAVSSQGEQQQQQQKGGKKDGPMRLSTTGDTRRDAVAKKFLEALSMVEGCEDCNPVAVAARIERALFAHFGSFNNDYKNKVKSLIYNLKDPKNPDLRKRVLSEEVDGPKFVTMTADEMQSEAKKKEDEKIRLEVMREAQRGIDQTEGTTDQFQCGKCRQRKCKYFQMQTRSADEPMTTFVTCMECGNKWKFC